MKVCVVQPPYSADYARSEECFRWEMNALDRCDGSMDVIVFPESADNPCFCATREQALESYRKYHAPLFEKAAVTARRCDAVVFINGKQETPTGLRNTTFAFDRSGALAGCYHKAHLTPRESSDGILDAAYSFCPHEPTVIEIDGIRYGFLTCYDFYFYEMFPVLAKLNLDIIIGCSHQRSDTHTAIETITRFCAYNTNTYVLRASVSMGEDSPVGGGSMIVAPDGEILANLKSRVGMITADIDPHKKYLKSAGFGGDMVSHSTYTERGRRPFLYRPAGPAIVPDDRMMPWPRKGAAVESLAALGAAVATGAHEVYFAPDSMDAPLETILQKLACHAVMNIAVTAATPLEDTVALIRRYDAEKHTVFVCDENTAAITAAFAADIPRCLAGGTVARAAALGCARVMLPADAFTPAVAEEAHVAGVRVAVLCDGDAPAGADVVFEKGM